MMKKIILVIAAAILTILGITNSVHAAPVQMADGNVFDAEFYAQAYPDVAAVFGTDPGMLYYHYQVCGAAEGRRPYASATTSFCTTPECEKEQFDRELLRLINEYRAANGYGPMLLHEAPSTVAAIMASSAKKEVVHGIPIYFPTAYARNIYEENGYFSIICCINEDYSQLYMPQDADPASMAAYAFRSLNKSKLLQEKYRYIGFGMVREGNFGYLVTEYARPRA